MSVSGAGLLYPSFEPSSKACLDKFGSTVSSREASRKQGTTGCITFIPAVGTSVATTEEQCKSKRMLQYFGITVSSRSLISLEIDILIFFNAIEHVNPLNTGISTAKAVQKICAAAHKFGPVKSFKAYVDLSRSESPSENVRSEIQSHGISLVDCPNNTNKNISCQMSGVCLVQIISA